MEKWLNRGFTITYIVEITRLQLQTSNRCKRLVPASACLHFDYATYKCVAELKYCSYWLYVQTFYALKNLPCLQAPFGIVSTQYSR